MTDPVGNATTWYHDALGRVSQETNQLGHSRHFAYDAGGRLEERIDRLGRKMRFDYNVFGQVRHEYWYDSNNEIVRTLTFDYDDAGQLTGASDPAAAYDYDPDRLGRTETYSQTIAGFSPSFDIAYTSTYNLAGNRTSLTASIDGTTDFENTFDYDDLGRLTRLDQESLGHTRIDFAYTATGQHKSLKRYADMDANENVANTFYAYDQLGRLGTMIHTKDTAAPASGWGAGALAGYLYTYDGASRLWTVSNYYDGQTALSTYGYDNTNQLTSADHASQADESYAYDANGNRVGPGYETGQNNQLLADGTYTYVYDTEGNRIRRTKMADGTFTEYTYDHRNRLTAVKDFDISGAST